MFLRVRNLLIIATAIVSLLSALSGCKQSSDSSGSAEIVNLKLNEKDSFNLIAKNTDGFTLAFENESAALYVNGVTAEIKFVNKKTGTEWFSNPSDRASDTLAMGDSVSKLNSQLTMTYYDGQNKSYTYFSKTDSVDYGQMSYETIENGLRVTYLMGQNTKFFVLPVVITKERMEGFLKKLDSSEQEELLANYDLCSLSEQTDETVKGIMLQRYPTLKNSDLYIFKMVRNSLDEIKRLPSYLGEAVEGLFEKAEYTEKDMEKDYEDNSIELPTQTNPVFKIPLEYTIANDELVVKIPYKQIKYDTTKYYLTDITLLPYFGAANSSKQGYIFVPDGAGAILNLNNGKSQYPPYEKKVYGTDMSIYKKSSSSGDNTQIYLPVFGMSRTENAFLAVIESGDAVGTVHADVSGRYTGYNMVYSSYDLINTSAQSEVLLNIGGAQNYQEKPLQSDIQVRYIFLESEKNDYTAMALRYQKYLLDAGLIKRKEISEKIPLTVNLLGAICYNTSFLGFPVRSTKVLTSYSEAVSIMEQLKQESVDTVSLKYTGWSNKGITSTSAKTVELIGTLGGKKGFSALVDYTKKNNIDFYPDTELSYVNETSMKNGFNSSKEAARSLSNATAVKPQYSLDLFRAVSGSSGQPYIVSPGLFQSYLASYLTSFGKLNLNSISFASLGTDLNSDYHKGHLIDRQDAKNAVVKSLNDAVEKGYQICVDGANVYTLASASTVVNMQPDCGYAYILDESVPFYQIVLHGIIPYSGQPLNRSADLEKDVLKLIETGTSPYFELMYAENYSLKETDYNNFGLNYKMWVKDAADVYQKVNKALSGCQSARIISHSKVQAGVFRTEYENGTVIYTNYNNQDITVDSTQVKAMDYAVVKVGS